MSDDYEFRRLEVPIEENLGRELVQIWAEIFQVGFAWLRKVLDGVETHANSDIVYLALHKDEPVASCRLTMCGPDRRLGGIGEVATLPEHRGHGLGRRLCEWAIADFEQSEGEALFLATGNPIAARLYTRLGWRSLPNSAVMLRVKDGRPPEEFMVDYFRGGVGLPVHIGRGSPEHRVPIVPLILTPHDWVLLDANTSILSIRYFNQQSCEGLYTRYEALAPPGAWFAATREDGAVVGLASVRSLVHDRFCVEAFTHPYYQEKYLSPLYETALNHAKKAKPVSIHTTSAKTDLLKQAVLKELGFADTGVERTVDLMGRTLEAAVYKRES